MSLKEKTKEIIPPPRVYSPIELEEFDKELEPYKVDGNLEGKPIKYVSIGSEYAYLQDKGIIWAKEKVAHETKGMSLLPMWRIKRLGSFAEHENKMGQYWYWKSKKNYAQDMQLLDWESAYQKMPQSNEITTDDFGAL